MIFKFLMWLPACRAALAPVLVSEGRTSVMSHCIALRMDVMYMRPYTSLALNVSNELKLQACKTSGEL